MKLYFIITFLLLISCRNEEEYTIKARITGIPDSTKMMLQDLSKGIFLDSAIVINNEFSFKGHLEEWPEELRIISGLEELKKGKLYYTDLLIGNENVSLNAHISGLPFNVSTSGSPTQKEAELYRKQLYNWNIIIDSLKKALQALPDSVCDIEKLGSEQKIKEVTSDFDKWQKKYLKDNFNSYIALLMYNYRRDFPPEVLDSLYSSLSAELKKSKYGKSVHLQLQFPPPDVGEMYHDFQSLDSYGNKFKLSDLKDKYILLQFAGTGCYWSNLAIKNMKEIYETYSDSIDFLSTFFDAKSDYQNYVLSNDIPWTCTWSPNGKFGEPPSKYGIIGTPMFYLISPDKKIIAKWFGYEDGIIENEIRKIMDGKSAL